MIRPSETSKQRPPGVGAWLMVSPMVLWLVLFVVAPTALLVVYSFCERDWLGRVTFTFTWENYLRAFDPKWLKIFVDSIGYALLTTGICILIGYPAAYFIGRSPAGLRNILITLVMLPFWTSFLIRTYAWIIILSRDGILNGTLISMGIISAPLEMMYTPFAIVLGLVYAYLPFMILPIYTSAERLDGSLIEASYDLGAGPITTYFKVILPLTRPGVIAGSLLVFIPSIAMFAITTLMGGGRNPTIGEVINDQFLAARNQPFGAALGSMLLLLFFVALGFMRSRARATIL